MKSAMATFSATITALKSEQKTQTNILNMERGSEQFSTNFGTQMFHTLLAICQLHGFISLGNPTPVVPSSIFGIPPDFSSEISQRYAYSDIILELLLVFLLRFFPGISSYIFSGISTSVYSDFT